MQNSSPPSRNANPPSTSAIAARRPSRPDRDERLVAGVVTEAVVHFLHAIDVEHEQRHGPTGDRRPLERGFEPFVESRGDSRGPVGESSNARRSSRAMCSAWPTAAATYRAAACKNSVSSVLSGESPRRGRGPQLAPHLAVDHDRHAEALGAAATLAQPLGDERHLVGVVDARAIRLAFQQQRLDCGELVERVHLIRREAHLTFGEHAHVDQDLQRATVELGAEIADRDRRCTECGTRSWPLFRASA